MAPKFDINQPLPAWALKHQVIHQAADAKDPRTGKYVNESFRKSVIKAGDNPLPTVVKKFGLKAARLVYGSPKQLP